MEFWVIASFLVGVAVGHYFWKQIKAWATQVLAPILDSIDKVVEVTSDAFVYLIKETTGHVVKRMEIGVQNVLTDEKRIEYKEEKVPPTEIPGEINSQLQERARLKLLEMAQ